MDWRTISPRVAPGNDEVFASQKDGPAGEKEER
jgi:hypothetical protein